MPGLVHLYRQVQCFWVKISILCEGCTESLLGLNSSIKLHLIRRVNSVEQPNKQQFIYDELLEEFHDVFEGVGCFEGEHHITTTPRLKPTIHATRRFALPLMPKLKTELDRMVAYGKSRAYACGKAELHKQFHGCYGKKQWGVTHLSRCTWTQWTHHQRTLSGSYKRGGYCTNAEEDGHSAQSILVENIKSLSWDQRNAEVTAPVLSNIWRNGNVRRIVCRKRQNIDTLYPLYPFD